MRDGTIQKDKSLLVRLRPKKIKPGYQRQILGRGGGDADEDAASKPSQHSDASSATPIGRDVNIKLLILSVVVLLSAVWATREPCACS